VLGYQLVADAHGMPKDAEYLRVRLKTERTRLLNWAEVAELTGGNESLSNNSRDLAYDVLRQKDQLLKSFVKFEIQKDTAEPDAIAGARDEDEDITMVIDDSNSMTKFITRTDSETELNRAQFPPKKQSLLAKSLGLVTDKGRGFTDRVRWASFDKKKFETLLQKLSALNDYMLELLTGHQLKRLEITQQQTHFQILQMNGKLETLLQIFQAGYSLNFSGSQGPVSPAQAYMQYQGLHEPARPAKQSSTSLQLAQLARSKAFNESIDQDRLDANVVSTLRLEGPVQDPQKTELKKDDFQLDDSLKGMRCEAKYRSSAGADEMNVWIEWKELDVTSLPRLSEKAVLDRVQKLAAVLLENENLDSRVPHCLGYIKDRDDERTRFGYVFEKPAGVDPSSVPISLLQLLSDKNVAKPSLTKRVSLAVAIAQSLNFMHAINWLHKSISSDNVLFFANGGKIDYSTPFVSGFNYSRPAHSEEMTEIPRRDARRDIYRHPNAQKEVAERRPTKNHYQKTYDIYSLGVVMMEIALWQPIHGVLKIKNLGEMKASETKKVRKKLLGDDDEEPSEFLNAVGGNVGEVFEEVIRVCLAASAAFGLRADDDQTSEAVGLKIQEQFFEKVVERLKTIVI
jgi:hypothetical protein